MKKFLATSLICSLLLCSACSSNINNDVGNDISTNYDDTSTNLINEPDVNLLGDIVSGEEAAERLVAIAKAELDLRDIDWSNYDISSFPVFDSENFKDDYTIGISGETNTFKYEIEKLTATVINIADNLKILRVPIRVTNIGKESVYLRKVDRIELKPNGGGIGTFTGLDTYETLDTAYLNFPDSIVGIKQEYKGYSKDELVSNLGLSEDEADAAYYGGGLNDGAAYEPGEYRIGAIYIPFSTLAVVSYDEVPGDMYSIPDISIGMRVFAYRDEPEGRVNTDTRVTLYPDLNEEIETVLWKDLGTNFFYHCIELRYDAPEGEFID